ncbi:hypothetical protein AVEN_242502-1 [Araneus ventricosus]|uniref:Uncharacterized protein n=1 Tax=Araneus ventricosus TaxID=182803 RepID=A0A4Y2PFF6_ARAVE|nr:hypothetical protein AVEN_242502-1 [Araneus ventricosus]
MKVLKNMQKFKDENDVARLRTRLLLGEEEHSKCPVLLPGSHEIIRRLQKDECTKPLRIAAPNDSNQDSSEDEDSSVKEVPDVVTG